MVAQVFSTLVSSGHPVRRRWREVRAPILDQPFIAVLAGNVEKVDWDQGDQLPIGTSDVAHSEERVDNRDPGFDEADPVVGECCLRGGRDGLLRLRTEVNILQLPD